MTTLPVPLSDFYVYVLLRDDGVTPFYIGKGRARRILIHERDALRGTSHKDRIIQQMLAAGVPVPKIKLAEGLTDEQAKQIERDMILLVGRYPIGPLANHTDGGDGVINLSPESRAKKSRANEKAWADPTVRSKRRNGMIAAWTPEMRAALSAKKIAAMDPAHVAALAERRRKKMIRKATREAKRIIKAALKETRKKKVRSTAHLNTAEAIAKRTATMRLPEVSAIRRAAQRAAFSTPDAKAKRSAASKRMWAEKRGHILKRRAISESQSVPSPKEVTGPQSVCSPVPTPSSG